MLANAMPITSRAIDSMAAWSISSWYRRCPENSKIRRHGVGRFLVPKSSLPKIVRALCMCTKSLLKELSLEKWVSQKFPETVFNLGMWVASRGHACPRFSRCTAKRKSLHRRLCGHMSGPILCWTSEIVIAFSRYLMMKVGVLWRTLCKAWSRQQRQACDYLSLAGKRWLLKVTSA